MHLLHAYVETIAWHGDGPVSAFHHLEYGMKATNAADLGDIQRQLDILQAEYMRLEESLRVVLPDLLTCHFYNIRCLPLGIPKIPL